MDNLTLSFRELIQALSERVGHQHLPFNGKATEYRDILIDGAVHESLVKSLVQKIYRGNRCSGIGSAVDIAVIFELLGRIRADILEQESTDVDAVSLLDHLGESLGEILDRTAAPASLHNGIPRLGPESAVKAEVIQLSPGVVR